MKILFFSPHAFIAVHSIPEAIVGEALKSRGHDVVMVNCNGALSTYCISMGSVGLSQQATADEKGAICKICKERRDLIQNEFRIKSLMLEEFILSEDEEELQMIMQKVHLDSFTKLEWMGVPIGKYALYEFMLKNKMNTLILNGAEWEEYKVYLVNAIKVAIAGPRILQTVKPDVIVTYNSLYSVNHVMCAYAEKYGIPHYTLHAGGHIKNRLSTMTIFKGVISSVLTSRHPVWKDLATKPISTRQVEIVAEHIGELLKATSPWVYSIASQKMSSEDLRIFFGIPENKPVLLATMSSADEEFASRQVDALPDFPEPIFPTTENWINQLLDFFRDRSDLFLIIRIHPRDFPNKREGVLSKQAIELKNLLVDLPDNVRINWPADQISIHDLVKITDVGLNTTSTVGLELGMFGVPVVVYNKHQLLTYSADINYVAEDRDDYFHKINSALADGWSIENVRKTFRWLSYQLNQIPIDISDGFQERPGAGTLMLRLYYFILKRLISKNRLEKIKLMRQIKNRSIPVKNARMLSAAIEGSVESHLDLGILQSVGDFSYQEETKAIKRELEKLIKLIQIDKDPHDVFNRKINKVLLRDAETNNHA